MEKKQFKAKKGVNKGRVQGVAERYKRSLALKGINRSPKTEEHKAKISKAKKGQLKGVLSGRKGIPNSIESNLRRSLSMMGKNTGPKSEEYKARKSAAYKGIVNLGPKARTVCPHCGLEGGVNVMKRWHFDNCRKTTLSNGNTIDELQNLNEALRPLRTTNEHIPL